VIVHPHSRFSLALVLSLALWYPTLRGTLAGDVDVLAAAIRWVAAYAVAAFATSFVSSLLHSYSPAAGEDDEPATAEA
jgi:hypothetical protein